MAAGGHGLLDAASREVLGTEGGCSAAPASGEGIGLAHSVRPPARCEHGLKEFQLDACVESRPEPGHWPLIVVALNQGSDGWAGVHFLSRAARVNIMYLHDASHRLWNDIQLSLKSVGAWPAVLLLQLCFNMEHGPWGDARWFAQLREGAASYVALASPERDELFFGLLPLILADSGDADMVCDKDFTTELFHNIPSCCKVMQQKVGMSRWFGIVAAAASVLPVWHGCSSRPTSASRWA